MIEPTIDKSYEQGYKDGESSVTADIDFCLSEEWGTESESWRDGIREVYQSGVEAERKRHETVIKQVCSDEDVHCEIWCQECGGVGEFLAKLRKLLETNQGETK